MNNEIEAHIAEDAMIEAIRESRPFTMLDTAHAASLRLNHAGHEFFRCLMEAISPMLELLAKCLRLSPQPSGKR